MANDPAQDAAVASPRKVMSKPGSGRGLRCLDNSANHSGEARGARSGGFDEREKRWGAFLAKELARRAITTQRNSRRKFLPQLGRLLRRRIQRQLRLNQRHFAHNYSGRLQIWPDVVDSLSTLTSTFKGGLGGTLHCTRRKRGNRALGNFSPFRRAWFESLTRAVVSPPLQLNILQPPS